MPVPNVFNELASANGDNVILPGLPGKKHRIRQVNIQNKDAFDPSEVSLYSVSPENDHELIIGPITLPPHQLLTLELASEEEEKFFVLEAGHSLVVSKADSLTLLVFGFNKPS